MVTIPNNPNNVHEYNGQCHIEAERGKMISESKIEHLISLIKIAKGTTCNDPVAEVVREVRSYAIGSLIAVIVTIVTVYCVGESKISDIAALILWVVLLVSLIISVAGIIIGHYLGKRKLGSFIAPLDEASAIMSRFKDSMPTVINDNS